MEFQPGTPGAEQLQALMTRRRINMSTEQEIEKA